MTEASAVPPHATDGARRDFLIASGWFDLEWYAAAVGESFADEREGLEHFLAHGSRSGVAPNATLAAMQSGSSPVRTGDMEAAVPAPDDPQLLREVAFIEGSGLFDAEFYAARHPSVAAAVDDLLLHFCRFGWREAKQPSAAFDVWHYWSTHLDPAREVVNPLVHYALMGQKQGLTTRAAFLPPRPGTVLSPERGVRRACLFAAYDIDGIIDDSLVEYVRELSRFSDVFLLADCDVDARELHKLDGITAGAWAIRHGAYDFGSYSMLARDLVGWNVLESYDEVLLVNDSSYLLKPLDDVFEQMERSVCDWWGLQATKGVARTAQPVQDVTVPPIPLDQVRGELLARYAEDPEYDFLVGSYFLAYRQPVIRDAGFRRLLDSVHRQRGKGAIVHKYEIGLTQYLVSQGYGFDTYIDALYPFQPIFTNQYFRLLERGFPLLKKYFLYQNHYDTPDLRDWKSRVTALVPEAPVDMLERNLLRTAPHDRLVRSFGIVTGPDGGIEVPTPLDRREFRRADRFSPTFAHWWAFVVSPDSHDLPSSARAVFEEVKDDPEVKKVVLTRSRRLDLGGENVVVLPITSPEGQHELMRCGIVLTAAGPRRALPVTLDDTHAVIALADGIDIEGRPPVELRPERVTTDVVSRVAGFAASSEIDRTLTAARLHPAEYDIGWVTGLPSADLVLASPERVADEIRREEREVRALVGDRRLVLLAPTTPGGGRTPYALDRDDVDWLTAWSEREGAVLGVREGSRSADRAVWRRLRGVGIDLGPLRFRHTAAVLRATDVLVTERAGLALDFTVTGRPVVPFFPDLDTRADRAYVDLEHVMPAPVCRDTGELTSALERVFAQPDPHAVVRYRRSRDLFHRYLDDGSSARVVEQLRRRPWETV
ncbi:rhamnan synthesis F family protein [Mumia zhuanghuii]|uniref:Uncharacterized protein n=1 Tax=Mumia zhuanghuii TaxID=2585211 RepID=A0A5C4MY55_9ACTN|nr:rhamnan synthesis F family protein [Mumia zhuanghuii]TNC48899.1 hypothetical protein FHE65_06320 [Mumia zhuanghuii]TNC49224.1 hypothetical protein FHE65_05740 [Mumia zhuanghuii]